MDGFTIGDLIILLILCSSALWGVFRGFAREAMDVFTWAAAAAGAAYFKDQIMPYIARWIGDPLALQILSFLVLFVILLILITLVTTPLLKLFRVKSLKTVNRLFGLLFGVARGFLICAVLWIAYIVAQQPKQLDAIIGARLGPTVHSAAWLLQGTSARLVTDPRFAANGQVVELLETIASFLSEVDQLYAAGPLSATPPIPPTPDQSKQPPLGGERKPLPAPRAPLLSAGFDRPMAPACLPDHNTA
jgi:membrane protein required for colicin V production